MNPRVLKESGFKHLDRVIELCASHNIYTILDLHTAPGGKHFCNARLSRYLSFNRAKYGVALRPWRTPCELCVQMLENTTNVVVNRL
jgi:hypothetical protein